MWAAQSLTSPRTPDDKKKEVCELLLELSGDSDDEVAMRASELTIVALCESQWLDLLGVLEQRAKSGQITNPPRFVGTFYTLYEVNSAGDTIKKRVIEVARTTVENNVNSGYTRAHSLRFIGKHDPDAKAFAVVFASDTDSSVKHEAEAIVGGGGK